MTVRPILTAPDPRLQAVSTDVEKVDAEIRKLVDDMAETMYDADGIGLAAVQIGVPKRVIVMDVGTGLIELINPEILERHGTQTGVEGCLSLPGIRGEVTRAQRVV